MDATGKVTGAAVGMTWVDATSEGVSDSAKVIVSTVPVDSIDVEPDTLQLTVGGMGNLTATVFDDAGNVLTGRVVTWLSRDGAIAGVDATGKVTGVAVGMTWVDATSEGVSDSAKVIVSTVPVDSIDVEPDTLQLTIGGMGNLTATVFDDAGNVLTGRVVTWLSRDGAIAGVDATGEVTGAAVGMTWVDATSEGVSDSAKVIVSTVPVDSIDVEPDTLQLTVGGMGNLTATVFDDAGNVLTGRVVTWLSRDGAIAGVDATGKVTGVAVGMTWVDAMSEGVSDSAKVVVSTVPVDSVKVSPGTADLVVGGMITFSFEAFDKDGNPLPGRSVTWASVDPSVATIDAATGKVTGVALGSTDITATVEGIVGTATVNVINLPLITCGELVSGTISAAAQVNEYAFAGQAGNLINLTIGETSGFAGSIDARLTLTAPSGAVVTVFDSNGQQKVTLAETGTFTIQVNANNLISTGSYNFSLDCIHPPNPSAVAMSYGDLESGTIATAAQVDLYTFTGTAGDLINLGIGETAGFAGSIDAQLTLIAPSSANEALFDASAQQKITLAESGTYVIRVTANNFVSSGSYNVNLEGLFPQSPDAVAMTYGDLVSGGIGVAAEVDLYTFTGTAGDLINLGIGETAGFAGSIDAQLTLIAPSSANEALFDASAQQKITLAESGTYVIRVTANNFVSSGSADRQPDRERHLCAACQCQQFRQHRLLRPGSPMMTASLPISGRQFLSYAQRNY